MKGETERSRTSRFARKVRGFFILLFRPFYDFYYNYGLSKASVLAYVLCANLILFVNLVLGFVSFINPFQTDTSSQRFMEVHFLWPMEDQILVTQAPLGFRIREGAVVGKQEYLEALDLYKEKYQRNPKIEIQTFSVTRSLGERAHKSLSAFYGKNGASSSYGIGIFILFSLAYVALLLATTTALAEVDTPIVRGNVPLILRESTFTRMKWYMPTLSSIKMHAGLFLLIPTVSALIIGALSWVQVYIDRYINPYSNANMVIVLSLSFVIVTSLFFIFYYYSLSEISGSNLFIGALIASGMWLLGRWFFTTYTAVSFERSLHNFAFVPMIMTWLYYFCAVFIVGAHVSHTLQYSYLSPVARAWIRKEADSHSQFTRMANWIKVDFLLRLAHTYYNKKEKEIVIREGKKRGPHSTDVADDIALYSQMHPSFVREILLDMVVKDMNLERQEKKKEEIKTKNAGLGLFKIKVEPRKQKCYLNKEPWEVNVSFLLHNLPEEKHLQEDLEDYEIPDYYKQYFSLNSIMLDRLYKDLLGEGLYFVSDLDKARDNFQEIEQKRTKEELEEQKKQKEESLESAAVSEVDQVTGPLASAEGLISEASLERRGVLSLPGPSPVAGQIRETVEISKTSEEDAQPPEEDPRQGLLFSSLQGETVKFPPSLEPEGTSEEEEIDPEKKILEEGTDQQGDPSPKDEVKAEGAEEEGKEEGGKEEDHTGGSLEPLYPPHPFPAVLSTKEKSILSSLFRVPGAEPPMEPQKAPSEDQLRGEPSIEDSEAKTEEEKPQEQREEPVGLKDAEEIREHNDFP